MEKLFCFQETDRRNLVSRSKTYLPDELVIELEGCARGAILYSWIKISFRFLNVVVKASGYVLVGVDFIPNFYFRKF